MCKAEKNNLGKGLIFWLINVIYGGFIMAMDWSQWWLLTMVAIHADMQIDANRESTHNTMRHFARTNVCRVWASLEYFFNEYLSLILVTQNIP